MSREWYDQHYRTYPREIGPWYTGAAVLLHRNQITPGVTIEIGSGNAEFLARIETDLRVGIDPSTEACQMAQSLGVPALAAVGERLPIRDQSIDLVLCTEVLEHVEDRSAVADEIKRVLTPQGSVVVSSPNYFNLPWLGVRIASDVLRKPNWIVRQPVDALLTYRSIVRTFTTKGFIIRDRLGTVLEPPGLWHWRARRGAPAWVTSLASLSFHPVIVFSQR